MNLGSTSRKTDESGSPTVWLDAEIHLLPPEWCAGGFVPDASETVLRRVLYDHPDRDVALAQASETGLLREMARSGVQGGVIMGLPWLDPAMCRRNNEYIAQVVRGHPACFVGLGVLPPPHACDLREEIARVQDLGLRGVKAIPAWQGYRLNDAAFTHALEELASRGMVLMPHTDHLFLDPDQADTAFSLYEVGQRYPELKILCPHLGGLLCLYHLHPPVRTALQNMLFITTVPTTMDMVRFALEAIGDEQIAFGSDFPFNPTHDQAYMRMAVEQLGLDREGCERIASGNLATFLGLELS